MQGASRERLRPRYKGGSIWKSWFFQNLASNLLGRCSAHKHLKGFKKREQSPLVMKKTWTINKRGRKKRWGCTKWWAKSKNSFSLTFPRKITPITPLPQSRRVSIEWELCQLTKPPQTGVYQLNSKSKSTRKIWKWWKTGWNPRGPSQRNPDHSSTFWRFLSGKRTLTTQLGTQSTCIAAAVKANPPWTPSLPN